MRSTLFIVRSYRLNKFTTQCFFCSKSVRTRPDQTRKKPAIFQSVLFQGVISIFNFLILISPQALTVWQANSLSTFVCFHFVDSLTVSRVSHTHTHIHLGTNFKIKFPILQFFQFVLSLSFSIVHIDGNAHIQTDRHAKPIPVWFDWSSRSTPCLERLK